MATEEKIQMRQELDSQGILQISLQGCIRTGEQISKVRVLMHFYDGVQDRLYPIAAQYFPAEEVSEAGEKTYYVSAFGKIQTAYVFLYGSDAKQVWMVPELWYGSERKICESSGVLLDGRAFARTRRQRAALPKNARREQSENFVAVKKADYGVAGKEALHLSKEEQKRSLGAGLHQFFMTVLAVCSLPGMLVDGYFAAKGYKDLVLEGKKAAGKKAVFFHANNKIHNFTGVTFSVRQWKTNYFAKKYAKYAKKPVTTNQMLFLSERKVEKNGNLELVWKAAQKKPEIKVVEFFNTKTVDRLSFQELRRAAKLCATSATIVLEDFYPQLHALHLRQETEVVQLWHACGAFKTFGFSRLGKPGGPPEASGNHRSYDQVFVSSPYVVPFYSEAFAVPECHVKALGVPRTDCFFDQDYARQVRSRLYETYPEWKDKRVVLFAPTFRGDGNRDAYYPMEQFDVEAFMEQMPEDVVLLLKHHPFVKESMEIPPAWRERVVDVSRTVPINDLLFLTDLLITDYSSCIFEASLLQIPMVFYVFDKETYMEERDIYGDFDCFVPGAQVTQGEELPEVVKECLENGQEDVQGEVFRQRYLSALDGNSTDRIVEELCKKF